MTLLSCRLRWYAYETGRLLLRHWKALFLVLSVLLPAMMPVFEQTRILGAPVLATLSPQHGSIWRFAWLMLLEASAALWFLIQRNAIGGGALMAYFRSLPCQPLQLRRTNLVVLILADTPLLLPVLAAMLTLAVLPQRGMHFLYVLDVLLTAMGTQLFLLEGSWRRGPWLLLANLLLVTGLDANGALSLILLSTGALTGLWIILTPVDLSRPMRLPDCLRRSSIARGKSSRQLGSLRLPPLLRLSARILCDDYRSSSVARSLALLLLVIGAIVLMQIWRFDSRALPLTLIIEALMALISANAYRDLLQAHHHAAPYRLSLPLSPAALAQADSLVVVLAYLPFALAVASAVAIHRHVADALVSLCSVVLMAPLLAALRIPQVYAPRQSLILACLLTGAWTLLVWRILL